MDEIERAERAGTRQDENAARTRLRGNAVAFTVLLAGGYALLRLMGGLLRLAGVG